MLGKQLPSFLSEIDSKMCIYKILTLLRVITWLSQNQSHIMCNTHDIQFMCGLLYSNCHGPCKIFRRIKLERSAIQLYNKVLLITYLVTDNRIDCGF